MALLASLVHAPALAQESCRAVGVSWPIAEKTLEGSVPVIGSASIDDFASYEIAWAPIGAPEEWSTIGTPRTERVFSGVLGHWDTTELADGAYRLRLSVSNATGHETCRVTVEDLKIANQIAATPAPSATATTPDDQDDRAAEEDTTPTGGAATPAGPTPTLAPIAHEAAADEPTGLVDARGLAAALGAEDWARAFARGFLAALCLVVVALAIYSRQRAA